MVFEATALGAVSGRVLDTEAYRSQPPGFDPTSGEGARMHGGRFNPPDSYPVLYLCTTRPCVVAELTRAAGHQGLRVADFLPRDVYRYRVSLDNVLDLTDTKVLRELGLRPLDLVRPDHVLTMQVGAAAHERRFQAVLSRSATGVGVVVAVFTENLGGARLEVVLGETWTDETVL